MYAVGDRVRYVGGAPGYDHPFDWEPLDGIPCVGDEGVITGQTKPEEALGGKTEYLLMQLNDAHKHGNSLGENGWRMLAEWLEPIEGE